VRAPAARRRGPAAALAHRSRLSSLSPPPPPPIRICAPHQLAQESLENLSGFLQPFLEATPRELEAAMPPLEGARAHVTLAKAAVLAARLRLRLRGEALEDDHPLQREQVCLGGGDDGRRAGRAVVSSVWGRVG
jgi:hypothetical protein